MKRQINKKKYIEMIKLFDGIKCTEQSCKNQKLSQSFYVILNIQIFLTFVLMDSIQIIKFIQLNQLIPTINNMNKTLRIFLTLCLVLLLSQQVSTACITDNNCETCPNNSSCTKCIDGFFAPNNGTCTSCALTGCKTCSQAGKCLSCLDNFKLKNDMCYICNITNCLQCSADNVCSRCATIQNVQLTRSADGSQCFSCNIPNCSNCIGPKICGLCNNGLDYNVQPIIPKSSTNSSGSDSNVTIVQNKEIIIYCFSCTIKDCLSCSSNGVCVICEKGYDLSNNTCNKCLAPCAKCSSGIINKCAECIVPFYYQKPTAQGKCIQKMIPFCLQPDSTNSSMCKVCQQFFGISETTKICQKKCNFPCTACSTSNKDLCTACEDGYLLQGNSCKECPRGCKNCQSDVTKCELCVDGFYLINSECKKCPGYCESCSALKKCQILAPSFAVGFVLIIIGNQNVLVSCQTGCKTCSSANHLACLLCDEGFFNSEGKCKPCDKTCKTCDQTDPSKCIKCFSNTFKDGDKCLSCDSTCLTCKSSTQLTTCISCKPETYLSGGKCIGGCPENCQNCQSPTACIKCKSGYTLFQDSENNNQIICAQCISTCRFCAKGEISTCLECGDNFYLSGTDCKACGQNCKTCVSDTQCRVCVDEYFLTEEGTCAQSCQHPCSTCATTDPTKCISCTAGYIFNPTTSKCDEVLNCEGSCRICPYGYVLSQGNCLKCGSTDCRYCSAMNVSKCTGCKKGYYLDTAAQLCKTCSTACASCYSQTACTKCAPGYTTMTGLSFGSGFICLPCADKCLTCRQNPKQCKTCIEEYKLYGWKCVRKFRFIFSLVLNINIKSFFKSFFVFLRAMARVINSRATDIFSVSRCKSGSTIFDASIDPNGNSNSAQSTNQFNSLMAALSSGNIGGIQITSSSIRTQGGQIQASSSNIGLILGICIPIGLLVLAAIILIIYKVANKQKVQNKYDNDNEGGNNVSDSKERLEHNAENS